MLRLLKQGLLAGLVLAALPLAAQAQATWRPTRPLELIAGGAPGGGLDVMARSIQAVIQHEKLIDVPVNVVNKPGGSGTIGQVYMNQHQRDGFVMMTTPELLTNTITGLSSIGLKDATPLALMITDPIIFSVSAKSPLTSGRDVAAALRKSTDSLSIAVSGAAGTHSHIAAALLVKALGGDPTKLKMVYFNSGSECVTALIGGHVDMVVTPSSSILGPRSAGLVRVIAVPTEQRLPGALADVPTWKEQGVDVDFSSWRGTMGPKGMTAAQQAFWGDIFRRVAQSPEWLTYAKRNLWVPDYKDSKDYAAYLAAQNVPLTAMLTELGLAHPK